jgi:hypothetical protein
MPPSNSSLVLSDAVLERLPFLRNSNVRFCDFGNVQITENAAIEPIEQQLERQQQLPPAGPASSAPVDDRVANKPPQQEGPPKPKVFSGVVVVTDEILAIASFPANTQPPLQMKHADIFGVSRDGASVIVRCSKEIKLTLSKVDAFIVHMIGIQDRNISRTLRLAGDPSSAPPGRHHHHHHHVGATGSPAAGGPLSPVAMDANSVRRALALAEEVAGVSSGAADASMERLWGVIRLGRGSHRAGPPTTELDEGSDASSVQTVQHVAESPREDLSHVDSPTRKGGDGGAGGPGAADGGGKRTPRAGALDSTSGADEDDDDDLPAYAEEAAVPPLLTDAASLRRRLWYFFMYYDHSRLSNIDELVRVHGVGDAKQLMKELEGTYGPEPHRFRWSIRDQTIYQREINSQLRAQLARAQDELLLLKENPHEKSTAVARVMARKEQLVAQMMGDPTHTALAAANPASPLNARRPGEAVASPKDNWRDIFSSVAGSGGGPASPTSSALEAQQAVRKMYHVISFHDVVQPPARAEQEWTLIVAGAFWAQLKQQVAHFGLARTYGARVEVTNEDVREMIVCNRACLLAWIAEAHGDCTLHLRSSVHDASCFMTLTEAFKEVAVGL